MSSENPSDDYGLLWMRNDEWREVGDCLVFHDRGWYYRACRELPESLIARYRETLRRQGRFTLEDVAAAAAEWERLKPDDPKLRAIAYVRPPQDLRRAGLESKDPDLPLLLLHAALSPSQRAQARGEGGLAYRQMTAAEHDLVRQSTVRWGTRLIPEAEVGEAVYRVTQSGAAYHLSLEFPSRSISAQLDLPRPVEAEQ